MKRERIMRIHIDIERVLEVIVLIGVAVHALVARSRRFASSSAAPVAVGAMTAPSTTRPGKHHVRKTATHDSG